jgi:NAD(P)-dependent dehydrogenase (short-subunit alcohol dehydrogenase family)
MNRLNGKVAIVTGAAGGMGESYARLMTLEGAKVMMVDLKEDMLAEAAANIRQQGGDVATAIADVAKMADWERIVRQTVEKYGLINVLVNNAGISPPTAVENFDQELWDKCLGVILYGTVYGMHCCIPEMRKTGGGSIINIASMKSYSAFPLGEKPIPGRGVDNPYCAAKGAIVSLTRASAFQYGVDNIRVNAIAPGIIRTPITNPILDNDVSPITQYWRKSMLLPSGFGVPDEVGWMGVFLASDEARHLTGVTIPVDGGYLAV